MAAPDYKECNCGWLDIASAPKGETVLTYSATHPWEDERICMATQDPRGHWRIYLDGQSCKPTHWKPLPPPPLSPHD
jgi:hypothetical protein